MFWEGFCINLCFSNDFAKVYFKEEMKNDAMTLKNSNNGFCPIKTGLVIMSVRLKGKESGHTC